MSFGSRAHAFDERAFDIRHERATSRRQRVRAVVRSHRRMVSLLAAGEWWSEVMHATRFTVVACKRTSGARGALARLQRAVLHRGFFFEGPPKLARTAPLPHSSGTMAPSIAW